uniref:Uncharacterized protein n=1 Tax=Peronospora matthiolae TaxID=2874970 RepID=A0AAV1UN47_9STRA
MKKQQRDELAERVGVEVDEEAVKKRKAKKNKSKKLKKKQQ